MAYISILILVVVILFAIHFYRKGKRRSVKPFPEHWHKLLMENVLYYQNLSEEDVTKMLRCISVMSLEHT